MAVTMTPSVQRQNERQNNIKHVQNFLERLVTSLLTSLQSVLQLNMNFIYFTKQRASPTTHYINVQSGEEDVRSRYQSGSPFSNNHNKDKPQGLIADLGAMCSIGRIFSSSQHMNASPTFWLIFFSPELQT